MKRPKLLISTRSNYFINWSKTENGYIFHDTFNGDIKAVENDLRQLDGFCDFTMTSLPIALVCKTFVALLVCDTEDFKTPLELQNLIFSDFSL